MTVPELVRLERFDQALAVLERVVVFDLSYVDWCAFRSVLDGIPEPVRVGDGRFAALYARTLVSTRAIDEVLEFTAKALESVNGTDATHAASLMLDRAWALARRGDDENAVRLLEQAMPHLQAQRSGVAWARLGLSRFILHQDWQGCFDQARSLLSGRSLGIALLDEGYCWFMEAETERALKLFFQALGLFHRDVYYLAWTHYNLGVGFLRDCRPEAGHHFQEAEHITRKSQLSNLRAAVLNGLAAAYRVRGEWLQAVEAYQQATRIATEPHDARMAWLNLGRTHRLRGQHGDALQALHRALHEFPTHQDDIHTELAAVNLALGFPDEARGHLEQARNPRGSDAWLAQLLHAELERRTDRPEQALHHLADVPMQSRLAREEVRAWPELFTLAGRAGLELPKPLEYIQHTVVELQVFGPLLVTVNGRALKLSPTTRVAELLAFMVLEGGRVTTERVIEALWPGSRVPAKRKALEQLVRDLRAALGWPGSVQALGRAYMLDPKTRWLLAERTGNADKFLEGMYSNWVSDAAQSLKSSE